MKVILELKEVLVLQELNKKRSVEDSPFLKDRSVLRSLSHYGLVRQSSLHWNITTIGKQVLKEHLPIMLDSSGNYIHPSNNTFLNKTLYH